MGIARARWAALPLFVTTLVGNAEPLPMPAWGVPATPAQLATRATTVFPDGRGLPEGRGTVAAGATLFAQRCVACHGSAGRGGSGGELAGGNPDLTAPQPDKTIGTYWPYAPTLFDFIRRSMPLNAPWSLSAREVYALCAYPLHLNGVVNAKFVADARTLPGVAMPNRHGFVPIDVTRAALEMHTPTNSPPRDQAP